jgi:hypothetical protein
MFRLGLVATFSALILTGCVSTYAYRDGDGGDYYYSDPQIDYYDAYGYPYSTIGYGYPRGWYGSIGYGYGYAPYLYYPPYYWHPRRDHRPPYRHHQPSPPGSPPGVIVDPPGGDPPGGGGNFRNRDHDREGGPWRHLEDVANRRRSPQPPPPGVVGGAQRTPAPVSQPARRMPQPAPGASNPPPRPRMESPRPSAPPGGRIEPRERELRRDTTP